MPTPSSWVDFRSPALFTDLYELRMAQVYVSNGMAEEATFSLFVRRLPKRRNYLVACGLEEVLNFLETVRFTSDSVEYLAETGNFNDRFLQWLADYRFTGEVRAIPEGTPVFPNEPILEVSGPIAEAQIAETFIMNQVHLQTTLASKARRVVTAAEGRAVVDFGPRRMHGIDAAIKAARAFQIAGVSATSNVLAGRLYGIPVSGTMAHSFVQAWDREAEAFRAFVDEYPETVLLVDTYDTIRGVERVCALARELGDNFRVRAIRLDSGDLGRLAKDARRILDAAGLERVQIFASSSLDEDRIAALVKDGAPIDGFGVGTKMGVSEDAPSLDIAYKLCAYAGRGRLKTSTGKPVLPGRKQVFRASKEEMDVGDMIAQANEDASGRPLLATVMRDGRRVTDDVPSLDDTRAHCEDAVARLPASIRSLASTAEPYPVRVSAALKAHHEALIHAYSEATE